MKKRLTGRLGVVTLALTIISMTLVGGTLAKYSKEVKGEATATVAKFAFDLNSATQATNSSTITLDDLFASTYNDGKVSATGKVVAPGTSGKVTISLENKGEVAIKPTFTITETNANSIPLQYAITADATAPTTDSDWTNADGLKNKATMNEAAVGAAAQSYYLHWRWDPASENAADTTLGTAGTATVKLDITCTVEQVVPAA